MAEEHITDTEKDEGYEIPVETPEDEPKGEQASEEAGSLEAEAAAPEEKDEEASPEQESGETEADPEEAPEEIPEEEGTENPESLQENETEEKTGFFGRRKKDKEKDKLKTQVEELNDKLRRSLAEFDNFRKRTEKEKSSMYVIGARDIVEKMLPVLDSFERGLASAPEGDAFAEGMQMIYRQMVTALEEAGVKPIEAVGQPFDPNFHNAVMHVEDETAGENVVVEEFQKGYTYKDFVVRHSMVKVAN